MNKTEKIPEKVKTEAKKIRAELKKEIKSSELLEKAEQFQKEVGTLSSEDMHRQFNI